MIFNLSNHYEIPKFKEYVNKLFSERAVVEVKKKLPNRTLAQNSYLHLLLGYFGSEYGCSLDEAKIDLPAANEHQMLIYAQQEIQRNQEFI